MNSFNAGCIWAFREKPFLKKWLAKLVLAGGKGCNRVVVASGCYVYMRLKTDGLVRSC